MSALSSGQPPEFFQEDCAAYAALLTALFDGELDEQSARNARRHLEQCVQCAQAFTQWKETRVMLQAAPVPMPPPGLLTRILLACRLLGLSHQSAASTLEVPPHVSHAAEDFALPQPRAWRDVPPAPPHLEATILQMTTRRANAESDALKMRLEPTVAPKQKVGTRQSKFWSLSRSSRYAALAVPAALFWLAFQSSPHGEIPLSNPDNVAPTELVASAPVAPAPVAPEDALSVLHPARSTPVANSKKAVPQKASMVAKTVPAAKHQLSDAASTFHPRSTSRIAAVTRHANAPASTFKPERVPVNRVAHRSADETQNATVAPGKTAPAPKVAAPVVALARREVARSTSAPRVAMVPVVERTVVKRMVVGERAASENNAPEATGNTEIEVLREVHELNESRPAAVREVVDAYRASLITEVSVDASEF